MEVIADVWLFTALFAISASICGLIILAGPLLFRYLRAAEDLRTVQCAHLRQTPRLGGVGVVVATLVGILTLGAEYPLMPAGLFALTLLPVFVFGLAEDLGWRISARGRLLAAASSAGLAVLLLGIWVRPVGIPGLDLILSITPLAIALTVLGATGVNGLAGGTALLIAAGIGLVAHQAGAGSLSAIALAIIPVILGFLVFNWPLGRIFLGDAGAYCMGHVLVWLAIALAWFHPEASAVSLTLMFFWPLMDTLLAIRRRLRAGRPVSAPDRLHFHQLVMRALMILSSGQLSRGVANSATTLILLPLVGAPIVTAVYLWNRPVAALVAWIGFAVLFHATYVGGLLVFRNNLWRRQLPWIRRSYNAAPVARPTVKRNS